MSTIARCSVRSATFATLAVCLTAGAAWAAESQPIRSFGAIQKVFTTSCALSSCHSTVARKGNLILEQEDLSYSLLVDHASDHPDAQTMGLLRVKSGDPANSFLIRKLKGMGPGDQMPQGGGMLPDDTIQMIEDWIARGAHTREEECQTKVTAAADDFGGAGHLQPVDPKLCSDQPPMGDYHWQPQPALEVPAAGDGVQLYVPPRDVEPGKEWETCYAFRFSELANADQLPSQFISQQEYRMHPGSHHMLLYMYFGEHPEQFKQGYFDCSAGNCTHPGECPEDSGELQIAIGGTQVAGTRYIVDYPAGVGLPILNPEKAVLIANLHYTNPFQPPQQIYGEGWINLYFYKLENFRAILDGIFAINSGDLIVGPYTTKTIQRLWRPRGFLTRQPADAAVFQLFGHMHKRGREFDIDYVDRFCTGDCDANRVVTVNELVRGVSIVLDGTPMNRCANMDGNVDGTISIDELVSGVRDALEGCNPDTRIYRTTQWDNAPVQDYDRPYLLVNRDQALRWTCTHENGRLLNNGEEDPTYPAKKCHEGCAACGWDEASRTCIFTRDRSNRVFQEGEPMPLVFGLLADDDMCNMFGYFINQADLDKLDQ